MSYQLLCDICGKDSGKGKAIFNMGTIELDVKNFKGDEFKIFIEMEIKDKRDYEFMQEFVNEYKNEKASCSLLVQKKEKVKGYGIAMFQNKTKKIINVEEKPQKPKSKFAILPVYLFEPKIFEALKKTQLGHNGELQVTDGIMTLIKNNNKVIGLKYSKKWFDIGTPKNFHDVIKYSYEISI